MAVNETHIDAPPARVFELLSSGKRYAEWVVGAKRIRAVDGTWPQPGSRFHHTVGIGPFTISDNTKVLEFEPPRRIVLEARARPLGRAQVELVVEPDGAGTRVRMTEELTGAPPVVRRLLDPTVRVRNAEALRRLRTCAEQAGDGDA